ncbi:phosphotransferase family protein [Jongsikchunia kroppenstedtii]|uniref:phosphotransferase family protein n=1 Tax=Jongsikchunia kroppenstedtii TaxID=1121721 RepID=UPI00036C7550|nr:phosphotransferase family protein [Jongsikchunia kroppenstedtii]
MSQSLGAELDWAALANWMRSRGIGDGEVADIEPIGGGTQNLMFALSSGGSRFVVRRGPKHLRPHTNDALRREIRVLDALAESAVPLPTLVAAENDESVWGSVFYLMRPVDGFNATVALPELHAASLDVRHRMGFCAVDALAALGAIDPSDVGLGDLGHPDGFRDRQVPQWLTALDKYVEFDGYAGHQLPAVDALAEWLTANQPTAFRAGIMHGDFHLANLMFRNDGPQVAAIVDWEMCTVGDPLLDLGWLLATWPEGDRTPAAADVLRQAGGLPTRSELVEYYGTVAARPVDDALWYAVMASFKLAIVLEGTHARACAGKAPAAVGDLLHSMAVGLLSQASHFTEKGF